MGDITALALGIKAATSDKRLGVAHYMCLIKDHALELVLHFVVVDDPSTTSLPLISSELSFAGWLRVYRVNSLVAFAARVLN